MQYFIRNVYGKDCTFPANDAAKIATDIAGTTTLRPRDMALLKTLGHTFERVHDPKTESDSLLAASQHGDKKKVDEWMKRAEAGEVVRIM